MLRAGMNVLRINCAHEGPAEWARIVHALAAARRDTARECRVLMDLGGPKIRTGPIARRRARRHLEAAVATSSARSVDAARVRLVAAARSPRSASPRPTLAVAGGAARDPAGPATSCASATPAARSACSWCRRSVASATASPPAIERAYVLDGTPVQIRRGGTRDGTRPLRRRRGRERGAFDVRRGRRARAHRARASPAEAAPRGPRAPPQAAASWRARCPRRSSASRSGHRVLFDDGQIEAVVERVARHGSSRSACAGTQKARW